MKKLAHFFKNQSISIHAINSHGQQETVSVPSNSLQQQNYIISFGIQLMQRHLLAYYKVAKQRDDAPLKWDHFEILAKGRSDTHCKVTETMLIQELKPTLNGTAVRF